MKAKNGKRSVLASACLFSCACASIALAACTRAAGRDAKPQTQVAQPVPVQSSTALPALERARLEYLFVAEALVEKAWPWMTHEETCVLLLAQSLQWVMNCEEAPPGFVRSAPDFRGRPVYARASSHVDADGRALSTAELLAVVPASAHVDEAGAQRSALSPRHPWLVLGSLAALREYHPAFRTCSTEEWLSVAMHEFFHTRALRAPSFAANLAQINSHALEPKALVALFEHDTNYHALVAREYTGLVVAAGRPPANASAARSALRAWHALYRKRRANLAARPNGDKLLASDRMFTYVEGVARFVESTFLTDPEQHPSEDILGDPSFHSFARWESYGYEVTPNRQLDAEYYYAIGFHLALLLDRVEPRWKQSVHVHPGWLVGMVEDVATGKPIVHENSHEVGTSGRMTH